MAPRNCATVVSKTSRNVTFVMPPLTKDQIPTVSGGHDGQSDPSGRENRVVGTGRGGSNNCAALRTDGIPGVFDFLPAWFGQILASGLVAPTSLLKYIFPKRLSGQVSSITTTVVQKGNLGTPSWRTAPVLDSFVPLPCRNRFPAKNRPN